MLPPFSLGCSSAAAPGGDNRYHQVDADNFLAPNYLVPEYLLLGVHLLLLVVHFQLALQEVRCLR